MPKQIPSGWAGDPTLQTLMGTPTSEVPIKSVVTIPNNPQKYAVVTDSRGGYKVYQGGTGFDQTIDSFGTTLILSADPNGTITNGPGWNNQNIKNNLGGNAGLGQLKNVAQKQVSQTFSTYLTPEERNNLKNPNLKSSIENAQSAPPSRDSNGDQRSDENSASSGPQPPQDPEIKGIEPLNPESFEEDKFRSYKYPLTINPSQDRILIQQLKYVRSGILQNESDLVDRGGSTKLKQLGSVTLPIPNDISESNSVGWGEDSLSNVASMLMPGATDMVGQAAKGDLVKALFTGLDTGTETLTSKGLGTRAKQFLTTRAAASIVGKIGIQINPEAYITRVTGAAINPNLELLFNGPKLRQFGFQFKMTARSQPEAAEIRRILKFFKKGMAPKRSTLEESAFFLGTPNVFKVHFKSGENELKSIGKFKTCALTAFSTNYTPDGFYAAFNDAAANGSQPIAVTMQLAFTELTPVFNDEYDNDPESDDVGPNNFTYESPLKIDNKNNSSESPDAQEPTNTGTTAADTGSGGRRGGGRSPGAIDPNSTNELRGRAR